MSIRMFEWFNVILKEYCILLYIWNNWVKILLVYNLLWLNCDDGNKYLENCIFSLYGVKEYVCEICSWW